MTYDNFKQYGAQRIQWFRYILRVIGDPHLGQVFWLHRCPGVCGIVTLHFGHTHSPPGPAEKGPP